VKQAVTVQDSAAQKLLALSNSLTEIVTVAILKIPQNNCASHDEENEIAANRKMPSYIRSTVGQSLIVSVCQYMWVKLVYSILIYLLILNLKSVGSI